MVAAGTITDMLKRAAAMLAVIYLGLALTGHVRERAGTLRCACKGDCWCKRRGLNLFRWVFPFRHSLG